MSRYSISKNYTCVDGRQMRHDPQTDDPYLQTDVGRCPDCDGEGCDLKPNDYACTCGFVGLRHTTICPTFPLTEEGGSPGYPPGGGDDDSDLD